MLSKLLIVCVLISVTTLVRADVTDNVNITFVDGAVEKQAVCLDGSPAGYHHAKGFGEGTNNWMLYLEGGGWCGTNVSCTNRARNGHRGSNKNITFQLLSGILTSNQTFNPDFFNWNRVSLRYCDGSSFLGDNEDSQTNVYRRGARIFNATVHELLEKGMKNACNVILAGNSAGGLATIMNCDRFRSLVPNASRLKCISDSGFFILADNLVGADSRATSFAHLVAFHGMAKFLPKSCTSRINASLCLFPENVVGDIQTPLFLLNSVYDKFQIGSNYLNPNPIDASHWQNCVKATPNNITCNTDEFELIKDFRTTFLRTLKGINGSLSRRVFINSCYIHDFLYKENWNGKPILGNKTIARAIGDWYFDRSSVIDIEYDIMNQDPLNCDMNN